MMCIACLFDLSIRDGDQTDVFDIQPESSHTVSLPISKDYSVFSYYHLISRMWISLFLFHLLELEK